MKNEILSLALACFINMSSKAQVYEYDSWVQLPTRSLYDHGMEEMYIRALAENAAYQRDEFYRYSDMAEDAFKKKRWNYVIYYVNEALKTHYESGHAYYMRGYAFEQLGNLRAAKRDYRRGRKHHSVEAIRALVSLKNGSKKSK